MKSWFILLFSVLPGTLILQSGAECYWRINDICEYHENHYKVGESWKTVDCFHCSCVKENKVICCDMVNYSVDLSNHCDVWYDPSTCQLSLLCGHSLMKTQKRSIKSDVPFNNKLDSHSAHPMT
ncbi:prostate-associated microseminoprotein [Chiloscyllium plagiosum]|uniref:prostate-associated microseminoprotein n=1 Tax=Chiloscyllium plagiosum TaxID=36176 RepID=UPI001CB80BEA|nr:prostate-associated microseminoprotein [Chiloscyllium plagiosum]